MDEGIQIDRSDEHFPNAASPRIAILEPGSKVRFDRFSQYLKQSAEILTMDEGMHKDRSDEQSTNADSPRIEHLEPGSKLNFDRF
jgi:hypothetical protein